MKMHRFTIWGIVSVLGVSACTVSETETPPLTGPSTFATSVVLSANPDTIALGQSGTAAGQQSLILLRVVDFNGLPKAGQTVRLDTVVNGSVVSCGQLSARTVITDSDGRAATVFTAPGTPPNCAAFNPDGTISIRATPVGTNFGVGNGASSV